MFIRLTQLVGKLTRLLAWLLTVGLGMMLFARLILLLYAEPRIRSLETIPGAQTAIVFGAGLRHDGSPTAVLRDRVSTAVNLYLQGKVESILMSGDSRSERYNEPASMKAYAIRLGVPESAIFIDPAGRRTYDTCARAISIYGIESAVLVTQQFHLPRAMYTCQVLGLPVYGAAADQRQYTHFSRLIWNLRELPATIRALWDLHVTRTGETMGSRQVN